ncbi:uncharacterized protein [Marmota flaviventris]|uniref:uncharacterized protein n=1 Tax=Marmota flaviventris TaxID=93162 RepID=UPI003A86BCF7
MQPPSACPCRGGIPWQGILLAVSLLTFWNPHPTAQLTIEPVPFDAAEGTDVLLLVHNASQNIIVYNWFKGETADGRHEIISYVVSTQVSTPGPAFSGREKIYSNGSLLIQNVTRNDTGFYALQTITANVRVQLATGEFRVHEKLPKPNITINNSQPMEGEDSLALTCEPEINYGSYLWKINNQMISDGDRLKLSNNNRTLTLFNVTRNDTGPYECETQNPVSANHSDLLTLNISYGPDAPIINPPDSHFRPGTNLNLSCHTDSNPPAQYSWSFNGRPLEYTQELSIPNLSTNKSGFHVCVAHNSVTNLNRTTTKNIAVSGLVAQPSLRATNTEPHSVAMTCFSDDPGISIMWIFNSQTLQLTDRMQLSPDHRTLSIDPVRQEDAGEYQCEASNLASSTRSERYRLAVISEERTPGLPVGAVAGIVTGVLVGVALLAALGCFLLHTRTGRASVQLGLRDHRTPASRPGQGPSDTSTSLAPPPGHRAAVPIYQELLNPDLDIYCRVDHKADVASYSFHRGDRAAGTMQPPSACPCRGGIPWQGVLLAVSLLTLWNPHPTALLTIVPVPFDVAEGRDVLLLVHNVSKTTAGYQWYRGQITDRSRLIVSYSNLTHSATQGPAFSGRETIYPNGSLLFVNVTQEDTGFYTLQATTADLASEAATGEFHVHEKLPKPNITINNSQPMEGEDSLALTCEPEINYGSYLWKINNQMIPDGDRLKLSNNTRTLILFNVTRNDTGPYECETQNPVSANHSDLLTLNISYGPDAPIINPPDSHFRPETNLNLSCHTDSNPPAQYSWSFNGRPLEYTQELSIPNLSTNKSGSYVCVAHNSVTNLNRTTTKNIAVSGLVAQPSLRATNTEPHSVAMTCFSDDPGISITWIFNSQTLQLTDRMQLSPDHRTLSIDPVRQEDAGEYQCEVSNPVSSTRSDRYRLAVISQERTPGLPVGAVAGIVTGVLVGVALLAALGCFLLHTRTGSYPGFPHLIPPQAKVPLTLPPPWPHLLATELLSPSTSSFHRGDRAAGTMQPPSACPCRGGIPWQGVLLAVSLLTLWNPHPTAQLTIEPVPADVAEGRDVLLFVHNVSKTTAGYQWYRGQITERSRLIVSYSNLTHSATQGPAFSGRETIYPNGSLLFVNVTQEDTGFYTLQATTADFDSEAATGEFHVHGLVAQPSLRATNTEPHSMAMTCLSDDPGISITWIFNSQTLQLTDRMQLSPDHRTLSIDPVRQEDAGEYQCEASNPASSSRSDRYRLAVISEERTPGLPVGAVAGIVTGVLVGVALVAALGCFLLHTRTGRASVQHGLRDHRTPASRPGQGPSDSSTSLAPPPGHRAAVPIYQELLNPDLDIYCQVDHKADVAWTWASQRVSVKLLPQRGQSRGTMQPPSACPCRGGIPWQGILLAVLLLTFWNPHPTAQLTIEPVPFDAAEGRDVILLVHDAPENAIGYHWYREQITDRDHVIVSYSNVTHSITQGSAFSGRERIYPNGSLLFMNVTQEDTGFYTLQTTTANFDAVTATGGFCVHGEGDRAAGTMQHPSACPCRGGIPWQGILLAVSLLTFWNPHPTAQLAIVPVPSDVAEGTDVLLLVHNVSENPVGYFWYRGQITNQNLLIVSYSNLTHSATQGPAFSGRETIYPNGSLLFVNVTKEDTGFYTLQTIAASLHIETATGEFHVHEKLPKPNITINNSQPMEGEDSLALTCEPEINYATYLWKINNQTIPDGDRLKLSNNNRTLTLFNVTRNDTGPYECEIQNPVSANRSDPLTLNISYGPDAPIINPPDSHFHPGTNLNLSCHADSNPPAQFSWSFNGRPLESTQELSIPNLSTNNSGSYVCVTHNSVTILTRTTTKNITVSGPLTPPHLTASNTRVAKGDSVQLTCIPNDTEISIPWLLNNKTLQLTDRMQLSLNNSILSINPVLKMDEGEYHCEVSNPISSLKSNPITLTVIGLVAQPSLRATNTEPHSVAMTCLSGDPGISITWIFNSQTLQLTDRMQLSPDHRTLSIDPVRQEDAGEYQCEASNLASSTRSDRYRLAVISEERTPGLPVGAVAGIVTGVLVGVALVAALGCFLLHTRTGRASVQHGLRDHRTPASRPGQGPSDSSTSLAPPPGHRSAVPIYQELLNPDLDIYCRVDHKADVDS